jgi:hypothetical protein
MRLGSAMLAHSLVDPILADRAMPLQNRVTPEGDIVAVAARGTMMGNRGGAMHDAERRLLARRWVSKQWICCRLDFNDRHRQVMAPNRYTELFFLDEATALAAGHRPCFECRRQDFLRFAEIWVRVHGKKGRATAGEMDGVLHAERIDSAGRKKTWTAPLASLPVGAFVRLEGRPHLVMRTSLAAWTAQRFEPPIARPADLVVDTLTPRAIVAVLQAGYAPTLHPSAEPADRQATG